MTNTNTRLAVNLTKLDCPWCPVGTLAPHAVVEADGVAEFMCDEHARRYWPSLFAELKRFEVTLTRDGSTDTVHTFTWGVTRQQAYNRAVILVEDPFWEGWSFAVANEPTAVRNDLPTHIEFGTA